MLLQWEGPAVIRWPESPALVQHEPHWMPSSPHPWGLRQHGTPNHPGAQGGRAGACLHGTAGPGVLGSPAPLQSPARALCRQLRD